jgi:hypothetical protein
MPTRKDLRPLNAKNVEDAKAARLAEAKKSPAGGRAMAIAYTLGRGPVVVNGEAGMLSAQVFTQMNKDRAERRSQCQHRGLGRRSPDPWP